MTKNDDDDDDYYYNYYLFLYLDTHKLNFINLKFTFQVKEKYLQS